MTRIECDAVLFDLDGVLVDSHACVEGHWRRWARQHDLDIDQILRVAHGRRTHETIELVAPGLDSMAEAADLTRAEERDIAGVLAVPGARDLLEQLPRDRWAVVTSGTTTTALTRLAHCGLPDPLVLVTADLVEQGKPHPEPYLKAARMLDIVPARCVVIEDAPVGVAAGRAAGARVVAVAARGNVAEFSDAHAIVTQLRDIPVISPATERILTLELASVSREDLR